jgi:hypothetical protein
MNLLVFFTSCQFEEKEFPRTPYETCKRGSRRITLLEYDNRSPKNCLLPMLSPSPKKMTQKRRIFFKLYFKHQQIFLFIFVLNLE